MNDIQVSVDNSQFENANMDDDWDPMREEYEDPFINSYDHGPGANLDAKLQKPAYRNFKNEEVYKIMVRRVPRGMTRTGIENLFLNFGAPNVSKFKEDTFALVEFKSLKEATKAIVALDSAPPYRLDVKFARSDEEQRRLDEKRRADEEIFRQVVAQHPYTSRSSETASNSNPGSQRPNLNLARMLGRGQNRGKLLLNACRGHNERQPGKRNAVWSDGKPDFVDAGFMYEPKKHRHDLSNRHLQNIVIMTAPAGSSVRQISMGRGYVPPAPDNNTGSVSESSERKTIGNDISVPLLTCTKCGTKTALKCSQCGTAYCSRKCQREDYFRHKPQCSVKEVIDAVGFHQQQPVETMPLSKAADSLKPSSSSSVPQINRFWGRPEKNVLSLLCSNSEARLTIQHVEQEAAKVHGQLSCSEASEFAHKLFILPPVLNNMTNSGFRPSVGSLVAVRHQGTVWRGYILSAPSVGSLADYTVALCDLGQVQKIALDNILRLPSDFHVVPEFGVTCEVLKADEALVHAVDEVKELSIKVADIAQGMVMGHVIAENTKSVIAEVKLTAWLPSYSNELTSVQLEPSCMVLLSAYYHQHCLYVQPIGRAYQEMLFSVMQKVAAVHVTSPPLGRAPYRGEMVACQYKNDKNYYRAVVYGGESNGKYQVFFVDFGNSDLASIEDLKALPEELKNVPCMAVKVTPQQVRSGPLTEAAVYYLDTILQKHLPLKLEYPDNSVEGVKLTCSDNTSFNSALNDALTPQWEQSMKDGKEPHDGQVFMLSAFKVLPLIKGGVQSGFTTVVVSNILQAEGRIAVCSLDFPEVVEHVLQTMAFQINEYCDSLDGNTTYSPRFQEVCLAKFKDGMWYRAMNLKTIIETQSACVLFLDYGNVEEVKFKDIRRMVSDFTQSPILMSLCRVEGIPNNPSEQVITRVKELIRVNEVYEIQVLDMESSGEYKISIPEISKQLKSEFAS